MSSFLPGFVLSLSLILAIGAQNAFVLRQGLRGEHVFWVCCLCSLSEVVLIMSGVLGVGALVRSVPWLAPMMLYGGAAFLLWYGARSLRSAWRGTAALEAGNARGAGLWQTLATVFALTWLNPHVYLDTVLLIGSVSAQYANQILFGLGAISASVLFFFLLGYGARMLAPVFSRPTAWRVLDVGVGLTMWGLAVKLLLT